MDVLGLDIGGANLKAAHTAGVARSLPFALWKDPGGLVEALRQLLEGLPAFDAIAVTMTGELCDCFESKHEGVAVILDAVQAVAAGRPVRVWTNEGVFVDPATARVQSAQVASANWLALATFAGRYAPSGLALLLDVGTTTTDVVPLQGGVPVPQGRDDLSRLMTGELAYRGWRRTPLMALLWGPAVAAERFATAHDLYLALGLIEEDQLDTDTADGRPATRDDAARRIARMWCAGPDEVDVFAAACLSGSRLEDEVGAAIARVVACLPRWPETVLVSGSGELLAEGGLAQSGLSGYVSVISLAAKLGASASAAGCAHAACVLCQEREGRG